MFLVIFCVQIPFNNASDHSNYSYINDKSIRRQVNKTTGGLDNGVTSR